MRLDLDSGRCDAGPAGLDERGRPRHPFGEAVDVDVLVFELVEDRPQLGDSVGVGHARRLVRVLRISHRRCSGARRQPRS